jgi:hypothetical protein
MHGCRPRAGGRARCCCRRGRSLAVAHQDDRAAARAISAPRCDCWTVATGHGAATLLPSRCRRQARRFLQLQQCPVPPDRWRCCWHVVRRGGGWWWGDWLLDSVPRGQVRRVRAGGRAPGDRCRAVLQVLGLLPAAGQRPARAAADGGVHRVRALQYTTTLPSTLFGLQF